MPRQIGSKISVCPNPGISSPKTTLSSAASSPHRSLSPPGESAGLPAEVAESL